ncbi:hypothetical protein GGF32_008158 [Allomyces javanicus]|nr:hypothetical protein GGF32_008158 [Allomyces javanicus]
MTAQPPLPPSPPSSWFIILAPLWSVPAIADLAPLRLVVHFRVGANHDHHGATAAAAAAAAAAGPAGLVPQLLPLRSSFIRLIKAADKAHAARVNSVVMLAVPEYAAQRFAAIKSLQQINATIATFQYSEKTIERTVALADAYTQRVLTGAHASASAASAAAATAADHTAGPLLAAPQWQLLTVACLSLAAVIEEEYDDPTVGDLTSIVEPLQYTAASVRDAKRSVAVTLEYQLSLPTAMDALYELLRTPGLDAYLAPFLQPFADPLLSQTELATPGWQDEQQQDLLPKRRLSPLIGIAQKYLIAALPDASLLGAHPVVLAAAAINVALNVIAHLAHSDPIVESEPSATSGGVARYHLLRELAIDVSSPAMATSAHTVAFCSARMNELLPRIEFLEGQFDGFLWLH